MNKFDRVRASALAVMALLTMSGASHGLGYGRPTSRAILGEKLSVAVPIRMEAGDDVSNECLAADVYFGDDKLSSIDIQAVLLPTVNESGEHVIRVTTRKIIDEPVITLYVVAGCGAKITRKFVAFADPPNTNLPVTNSSSPEAPVTYSSKPGRVTLGGLTIDTGGTTIAAVVSDGAASGPRLKRRDKTDKTSVAVEAASGASVLSSAPGLALSADGQARLVKSSPATGLAEAGRLKAMAKDPTGGRLVLDPIDTEVVNLPGLRMSSGLQGSGPSEAPSAEVLQHRAAATALWLVLNASPDEIFRDRQRLKELEQRFAALKQESEKARSTLAEMQARVQRAEAGQGSPWMLYGLGAVALLLGGALVFVTKRARGASASGLDWLKSNPEPAVESVQSEPVSAQEALNRTFAGFMPVPPSVESSDAGAVNPAEAPVAPRPVPVLNQPLPTFVIPDPVVRPVRTARTEPPREVSVEELIDLEQQAEFFIVLGQDDAAIDLLEVHVQSTTGASPLPFLKLLEIYQRLGRRPDYERVQTQFNQRFNGYAPAWESDLLHGRNLHDYPGVVDRIQALWSVPGKAMDLLERSLTRPDAEVETFDLPAYRELLFLYAVARDLSEKEGEARLVVNLTEEFNHDLDELSANESSEPLMASRPIKAKPEAMPSISLDLSLDDLQPMEQGIERSDAPKAPATIDFEPVDMGFPDPTVKS